MDKSQTGQLTERELGKALVNGDYTSFDQHTVRMMIRMFDVDKSGSINFDEFWYGFITPPTFSVPSLACECMY